MKFSVRYLDIVRALKLVGKDWEYAKIMSLDGGHYTFNLEFAEFYGAYRKLLKFDVKTIQDSYAIIDMHDFMIINLIFEQENKCGKTD